MKKFKKLNLMLLFTAISMLVITACAGGPTIKEFADTASPQEEVSNLDRDLQAAKSKQMDVLSPTNYNEAREALEDAKKSLSSKSAAKDTLYDVAKGQAYLMRAKQFSQLSHDNIADVIAARRLALEANADTLLKADFKEIDEDLTDVTSQIEKNNLSAASDERSELQLAYLKLELLAIKQARLGKAQTIIAKAIDDGADEYAPRSLAIAQKSVLDTDAFITANRHDTVQVGSRSDATLKSATHLLKITHAAKKGTKVTSEDRALKFENEQNKVASKTALLESKNSELQSQRSQNKGLQSEQDFNRAFEKARAQFTKSEAEVYKQGNNLMIRLRGLEFPSAQAVIKGSNFPLLAKVQKVITEFGNSSIVIEGHTDSMGGKGPNEKLSTERAEAVKEYLMSNAANTSIDISAVGFDYQKPLASNKTEQGRAQNRRVDIIITPEESSTMSH